MLWASTTIQLRHDDNILVPTFTLGKASQIIGVGNWRHVEELNPPTFMEGERYCSVIVLVGEVYNMNSRHLEKDCLFWRKSRFLESVKSYENDLKCA